jgi:hypothetical protein
MRIRHAACLREFCHYHYTKAGYVLQGYRLPDVQYF